MRSLNSRWIMIAGALAIHLVLAAVAAAQVSSDHYRVEDVALPEGIAPEASGVTVTADGDVVVCFRRGYIYIRNEETKEWRRFASGLHSPLGIIAGAPGEFFVAQLPELTRVADTDGDGTADVYETVCDAWGVSGNYHEFNAGPARDAEGNFYMALGSASFVNRELPKPPVRGEFTLKGRLSENPAPGLANESTHYSPVPYRGWVVKITPDGTMTPIASGFRQPNGIGFNAQGDLFSVDNQGDWVGTSPIHHVTPGDFHGHPSSLNWDPTFEYDPVEAPIEVLSKMRKMPAIQFPQNDMAGSISQPLVDTTGGAFGPYAGQLFVAEWTYPRMFRVTLERVNGEYQGACFMFLEGEGLELASNRIAFAPDGSLYVAQTARGWGAREGLQRIVWTGEVAMDILDINLIRKGFKLTFTKPLRRETAEDPSNYGFVHYYYNYHATYGSDKMDVTPAPVKEARVSDDGLSVELTIDELIPGRIYELRPGDIRSADGEKLVATIAAYTLNELYK
jgi:glucose/arabinose dehydrogenase